MDSMVISTPVDEALMAVSVDFRHIPQNDLKLQIDSCIYIVATQQGKCLIGCTSNYRRVANNNGKCFLSTVDFYCKKVTMYRFPSVNSSAQKDAITTHCKSVLNGDAFDQKSLYDVLYTCAAITGTMPVMTL